MMVLRYIVGMVLFFAFAGYLTSKAENFVCVEQDGGMQRCMEVDDAVSTGYSVDCLHGMRECKKTQPHDGSVRGNFKHVF